jgi:hypothetical protein
MNRTSFEAIARQALPCSRRWIAGGALGAALTGASLLATEEAGAGKRGKRGKKRKKSKKKCRGQVRKLAECLPGEDTQWCTPAPGNPKTCCPEERTYAVCDLEDKTASGECGDPAAPSVCCPKSRLCGNRCCEGPFTCLDASTSTCSGEPPVYARLRRPR